MNPNEDISSVASITNEVVTEIAYQRHCWGIESDDTKNTPWMWTAYIAQQAARWMNGGFLPLQSSRSSLFRTAMIKTAATAIAAIDSLDRQRAANGCAFYEEQRDGQ